MPRGGSDHARPQLLYSRLRLQFKARVDEPAVLRVANHRTERLAPLVCTNGMENPTDELAAATLRPNPRQLTSAAEGLMRHCTGSSTDEPSYGKSN